MKTRTILTAAALTLAALAVPATAAATTPPKTDCPTVVHKDTAGWTLLGGATATLHTGKGIVLKTTADNAGKATFVQGVDVKLKHVGQLGYQTETVAGHTHPAALPSYFLEVDVNDDGTYDTRLIWEPYWNTPAGAGVAGTPPLGTSTHNVEGGAFWSSKAYDGYFIAGAGGPPFYKLADVAAKYPNATVTGYGINLGTYNPGVAARVNDVVFGCSKHSWLPAPVTPTSSPTKSPTGTPTSSPTGSPTASPTSSPAVYYENCDAVRKAGKAPLLKGQPGYREGLDSDKDGVACEVATASPSASKSPSKSPVVVVPVDSSSDLPNTGSPVALVIGTGVLLAAAGAALVLVRRRKTRFEA